MMIPDPMQISFTAQLHILRHFSEIDEEYRKELKASAGFSDEDMDKQLTIAGSKFHPEFAKNPLHLLEMVRCHEKFSYPDIREWKANRYVIKMHFSRKNYPHGVGRDALIRLDDLLAEEKALVKKQERDGMLVNQVKINRINPTWQVNVVLWKEPELSVRTIFPGIYAPPLPDPGKQTETGLMTSRHFWEQHAFITE
ncbi:MAG: hypothetical protein GXO86_08675 [Chlorobi bacterium]|nr:hypothetical protein [Chlorobiota bacterium]